MTLDPRTGRRRILTFGLWFLAVWFIDFGSVWIVDAVITGEEIWLIGPAILILLTTIGFIGRTLSLETIYIGPLDVRRVGIFGEHSIRWADVTGSRWITRPRVKNRRPVRILVIEGSEGQELQVAPHQVSDPDGVLTWAIAEAKAGRPEAIDERVRRDGKRPAKTKVYAVQGVIGTVLFVAIGVLLFPLRLERHAERDIRRIAQLPLDERIAEATGIAESPWQNDRTRCRASSIIVFSRLSLGEVAVAAEQCDAMLATGCTHAPYEECQMVHAFLRAEANLAAGQHAEAMAELGALDSCLLKACVSIRIRVLRAAGEEEQAQMLAEQCREQFSESLDLDLLAPCREVP